MKKFEGYGPGWNRCDCGLPLKRTKAVAVKPWEYCGIEWFHA
tara:strand:- start:118 stop:243 length:126 start_codon:yes stop_codon:yes gene_type:complete